MFCYKCGTEIRLSGRPSRQDTCPKCAAYVHCCRNCRFYDPNAHNQCREPQAEWVRDREKANFCEYFEAGEVMQIPADKSRKEEARKKLEELFKKK
ncbi:MAG: hypothetical protein ACE5NJ_05195 [Thermodesulfobacteriota bacterium]